MSMTKLLASKEAARNPKIVRDILIEFLEEIKEGISNDKPINDLIESCKKEDFSIYDAINIYKEILKLSEESIVKQTIAYKGKQIPTNPISKTLQEKVANIITQKGE